MAVQVTRTYVGSIQNQRQVCESLNSLGDSAAKVWNVTRWIAGRIWAETGEIPDEATLKAYMKNQSCWEDLNAYSSQKVIEELSDAFQSWFKLRAKDDTANPPGYRKHGDSRPKSTVTFKANGFKLDPEHGRVRLSKGANLKDGGRYAHDFILCEYEIRQDVDLDEVESVQNVRAVWNGDEWELHFVCKIQIVQPESPGEKTAGVDLGICNTAAVSVGTETFLYPGNALKEDAHYFRQEEYDTEGENGPSNHAAWARQKKARRQTHFLHAVAKDIVEQCAARDVGTIAVGHPKNIRDDDDWGRHGNKRLHDWAFETLLSHIEYKAEERGIDVERVDEYELATSITCCECGMKTDSNLSRFEYLKAV